MEIDEGFIVGVYNYCDSWCERCRFTAWCRVFAMRTEAEAGNDPNLKAIIEAPPLGHELPTKPPPWVAEFLEDLDEISEDAAAAVRQEEQKPVNERMRPRMRAEHQLLGDFAVGYLHRLHDWIATRPAPGNDDVSDPRRVIDWYGTLLPAKVRRAVHGLTDALRDGPDDWPADHDGSAKVALIAIDRSNAAWLDAVERGLVGVDVAAPFVTDLAWLREELEKTFPGARAFVRPGFDEPDEVERLFNQAW